MCLLSSLFRLVPNTWASLHVITKIRFRSLGVSGGPSYPLTWAS